MQCPSQGHVFEHSVPNWWLSWGGEVKPQGRSGSLEMSLGFVAWVLCPILALLPMAAATRPGDLVPAAMLSSSRWKRSTNQESKETFPHTASCWVYGHNSKKLPHSPWDLPQMAELALTQRCGVSIILLHSFHTLSSERDARNWRLSQEQREVCLLKMGFLVRRRHGDTRAWQEQRPSLGTGPTHLTPSCSPLIFPLSLFGSPRPPPPSCTIPWSVLKLQAP